MTAGLACRSMCRWNHRCFPNSLVSPNIQLCKGEQKTSKGRVRVYLMGTSGDPGYGLTDAWP